MLATVLGTCIRRNCPRQNPMDKIHGQEKFLLRDDRLLHRRRARHIRGAAPNNLCLCGAGRESRGGREQKTQQKKGGRKSGIKGWNVQGGASKVGRRKGGGFHLICRKRMVCVCSIKALLKLRHVQTICGKWAALELGGRSRTTLAVAISTIICVVTIISN